jgi:competence protein ComEA
MVLSIGSAQAQTSPRAPREQAEPAAATEGVVNLNEATADEIERLPAIGPAKAKAIVDYRKQHPFRRVEDLGKVKGIGRKTLVKLRPYVTLKGPTTLASEPKAASASKK